MILFKDNRVVSVLFGESAGIIGAFILRFTSFSDSDEVYLMSFPGPSVAAMFALTALVSIVVSVIPIIYVYRNDLSKKNKIIRI